MTISSIAWNTVPGYDFVNFDAFYIHMGYCASDELTETFDSNYIPGSKIQVFQRTSAYTVNAVYPWTAISLDTPFFYDPAEGNLIIEIDWPNGDHEIYTFNYGTGSNSLVMGSYGASTGTVFTDAPYLQLEGELSLSQTTFAGIKATFR